MAPIVIMVVLARTEFLQPSLSPSQYAKIALRKQPMLEIVVTVLSEFVLDSLSKLWT